MARLQRPADQQNASNVVGTFEQVVKMLGFVLGGFYVLGLVIANAELQHLGLSDFSILQPRCIATGMLFALYIIFAMLLLAPVAVLFVVGFILLVDSSKPRMARIGLALGLIAACVVLECVFALLTSLFYGSLTPWVVMNAPETYEAYSKLSFWSAWTCWQINYALSELFGNPWAAVTAAIGVLWVGAEIAEYRSISTDGQKKMGTVGSTGGGGPCVRCYRICGRRVSEP